MLLEKGCSFVSFDVFDYVRVCASRHERDADDLILRAILEVRSGADDDWKEKASCPAVLCCACNNSTPNSS